MAENEQNHPDRPYNTFLGKTILLTGGTGFLGKVILERLLRVFDIEKVYIIIRDKKGLNGSERLQNIFEGPLFDSVRELKGDSIFNKCQVITGDITKKNLDMEIDDRMLLKKSVDIVLHSAATVKFDEPLRNAIEINTSGTQRILDFAKEIQTLKIFVHISTAYCHSEEKIVLEKFYKPPADPNDVMNMVTWMSDKQLNDITPILLNGLPNTYTFSKALAEEIVAKEINNLPALVVRPSIVVPIWKQPIPGWTDNVNGPTGVLIGAGKGVIRTMYGNKDALADFISVDAVADAIFCAVAKYLMTEETLQICNLCTSNEVLITWGEVIEIGKKVALEDFPFDTVLWRPGGQIRKSKILHFLALIFYQFLPALLIDMIAFCFGYKPFLWKIQLRIFEGLKVLDYFTLNEWRFSYDNTLSIRNWLNSTEQKKYTVDPENIDVMEYFKTCAYASRKYILKEPDENLPRARIVMKILFWLDLIINILSKILLSYLLYKYILLPLYSLYIEHNT